MRQLLEDNFTVVSAGMALGAPRVSVDALRELRRLLLEGGFRRSFCDDSPVVQESRDGQAEKDGAVAATGRTAPDEYRVRVEPPSRSARSRADEGLNGPGLFVDAGGRGRAVSTSLDLVSLNSCAGVNDRPMSVCVFPAAQARSNEITINGR
jgi:hypothetical protein